MTWALALILIGCGGGVNAEIANDTEAPPDLAGPVIVHTPVSDGQLYGYDVLLDATVTDASDVFLVEVYYQRETSVEWKSRVFNEVGGGLYQVAIPGSDVGSGGMRYYLVATDEWDNTACLPDDCESDAWHFSVVPP